MQSCDPWGLAAFKNHLNNARHKSPFVCTEGDCSRRKFEVKSSFIRHLQNYHEIPQQVSEESPSSSSSSPSSLSLSSKTSSSGSSSPTSCDSDNDSASSSPAQSPLRNENAELIPARIYLYDDLFENHVEEERSYSEKLEREAALLILNLRRRGNVTGVAIAEFGKESQKLIDQIVSATKEEIVNNLHTEGVNQDIINRCVSNLPPCEPFKNLLRKDQQMKYFEEKFHMVPPKTILLGVREENRIDEAGNSIPVQVQTSFQYTSVKKILVSVLNNPVLFKLIHSEKKSTDGKLRSYLDGSIAAGHFLISQYPFTIRIVLHADDYQTGNPLGSKSGFHKVTGVNMQLQNLPPEENARLRSIFVLVQAYRNDLPEGRGIDPLLEPIFAEMEELESEEGVIVPVNGRPYPLRATIIAVAADDLEAHEMCGLLSPSANHFCTHCLVLRGDMHRDIFAMGALRTKDAHLAHTEELQTKSKRYVASTYGLERKSLLVRESKFSSFPEAAIKDGMHDILKGCAPMEIKLALHEFCAKKKLFDANAFNNALQTFNYGPADLKNKPSPNFTDESIQNQGCYTLHQSAAQTWCLLRIFPFIVVSLSVARDDPHMRMVVLLKRISDIVFSHVVSENDLILLDELIHEHHRLFMQLYPPPELTGVLENENVEENADDFIGEFLQDEEAAVDDPQQPSTSQQRQPQEDATKKKKKVIRPINKTHHLLHVSSLMRKYGPVVLYWCFRFEGIHAIAKRFASIVGNFKNLPKTFAHLHQMNQCAQLLELTTSAKEDISYSPGQVMTVARSNYSKALVDSGLDLSAAIEEIKAVTVCGFSYVKGLYVNLPFTLNNLPLFGVIVSVFIHEGSIYLVTKDCNVREYDRTFGAYLIEEGNTLRTILCSNLTQDRPMTRWTPDNVTFYLSPRRTLAETALQADL